ncbi:MAG: DUF424 domain-containing protein [Candidatus Nitrosotenuis sp.]
MKFFIRTSNYQNSRMLNICDEELLGKTVKQDKLQITISASYYGHRLVDQTEAERLMKSSSILNMVGKDTIDMSIKLKIGSRAGVKTIDDVPFLIVFKM